MSRWKKGALPTEDVTHNITPNFMRAHLVRKGWTVRDFGRIVRCIDPLDKKWTGPLRESYQRQGAGRS